MRERMQKTGFWLVPVLAVTILAVGAREAWASTYSATCMDDGWTFLGYQPSWQACWDACKALHDDLIDIHYARRAVAAASSSQHHGLDRTWLTDPAHPSLSGIQPPTGEHPVFSPCE